MGLQEVERRPADHLLGRVADGLPLAASVHNDMRDEVRHLLIIYFILFYLSLKILK